jgi:two-component system, cell cycle response regulator
VADLPRILVVAPAKQDRAALVQQLSSLYDVKEASDGDMAWQALILDQSIRVVISEVQLDKLSGHQLLERLRASRMRYLQQMPFMLFASEAEEEVRSKARGLGVSDFITKGASSGDVFARLDNLLNLPQFSAAQRVSGEHVAHDPSTGLLSRKYLELQLAQALSHSARHGTDVSLMVIGFDGYKALSQKLGPAAAEALGKRFAGMLAGKVRQEDSLGHLGDGQYAVVSPGTAPNFCASFAERVRLAVEAAKLSVQGQSLLLTVSIGLASVPADRVSSAGGLLELAGQRMQVAMQTGGNRAEAGGAVQEARSVSLSHALDLLKANRPETLLPHLDVLLGQLLPLLALMDKELDLTLPVAEIERYLGERKTKQK